MRLSIKDLWTIYSNHLQMGGLDAGTSADIADMLIWMHRHGFDAASPVALRARDSASPSGQNGIERMLQGSTLVLRSRQRTLLTTAPAVFDLAVDACRRTGCDSVRMSGFRDLELAPGLGAFASSRGVEVDIQWRDVNRSWRLTVRDEGCRVGIGWSPAVPAVDTTTPDPVLRFPGSGDPWQPEACTTAAGENDMVVLDESDAADGISLDDEHWQALRASAERMLVPESETSRSRGAGAGADD